MKNIIHLSILLLFSTSSKSQSAYDSLEQCDRVKTEITPDTIGCKEGYVKVQTSRRGGFRKIKCAYIVKIGNDFYVNNIKMEFLKHEN